MSYFAGAENKDERVLVPDLGSLTSIYDRFVIFFQAFFSAVWILNLKLGFRARELFYCLKGGRVDYGQEHSEVYGHSRFGRFYQQGDLGIGKINFYCIFVLFVIIFTSPPTLETLN